MPPDATQSFELRSDSESCRAEAMLRLSLRIVLLYKNMTRTVCHTKKRSKLRWRCSKSSL